MVEWNCLVLISDTLQSIELLFRTCSNCQGVIFSYATRRSFTVRLQNDMTLLVAYSSTRVNTQLTVTNGTWHLLTLTYDLEEQVLSCYLVSIVLHYQFHVIMTMTNFTRLDHRSFTSIVQVDVASSVLCYASGLTYIKS
jgi:hypothetical protein